MTRERGTSARRIVAGMLLAVALQATSRAETSPRTPDSIDPCALVDDADILAAMKQEDVGGKTTPIKRSEKPNPMGEGPDYGRACDIRWAQEETYTAEELEGPPIEHRKFKPRVKPKGTVYRYRTGFDITIAIISAEMYRLAALSGKSKPVSGLGDEAVRVSRTYVRVGDLAVFLFESPSESVEQAILTAVVPRLRAAKPAIRSNDWGAACAPSAGPKPLVALSTSLGEIKLELCPERAPITVENFLAYVRAGYYDGTVFHRVIPNFVVQGGGHTADLREKWEGRLPPIRNESWHGLVNDVATIAMARGPLMDSATSEFFINLKANHFLDNGRANDGMGQAVFGRVLEGIEVVRKIEQVKTGNRLFYRDVPLEPVTIVSARVVGE